ncbi:hypothetical protein [Streptomyces koyangensis]
MTVPLLAATAFVLGAAETFRDTAGHSVLPRLVEEAQLERANGRLIGTEIVGNEFLGPLIGALLFATAMFPAAGRGRLGAGGRRDPGAHPAEGRLHRGRSARPGGAAPPAHRVAGRRPPAAGPPPARGGDLRRLGHRLRRRRLVVGAGGLQRQRPRASGGRFGLLLAAGAVGGTGGAACAARLAGRFPPHLVLSSSALLCGLPAVAVAASGTTAVTAVMPAPSSGGFALWNVVALSTRRREAPRELLGRVTGAGTASSSSAAARWAPSPAACSPTPSA